MGGTRREGLSDNKSNVVTISGGATSGYSNRECPDATHRAEMVPVGVLCQLKALKGGAELLHHGEGSPRNGVQCDKISSLLVRKEILIPRGPLSTTLLGI